MKVSQQFRSKCFAMMPQSIWRVPILTTTVFILVCGSRLNADQIERVVSFEEQASILTMLRSAYSNNISNIMPVLGAATINDTLRLDYVEDSALSAIVPSPSEYPLIETTSVEIGAFISDSFRDRYQWTNKRIISRQYTSTQSSSTYSLASDALTSESAYVVGERKAWRLDFGAPNPSELLDPTTGKRLIRKVSLHDRKEGDEMRLANDFDFSFYFSPFGDVNSTMERLSDLIALNSTAPHLIGENNGVWVIELTDDDFPEADATYVLKLKGRDGVPGPFTDETIIFDPSVAYNIISYHLTQAGASIAEWTATYLETQHGFVPQVVSRRDWNPTSGVLEFERTMSLATATTQASLPDEAFTIAALFPNDEVVAVVDYVTAEATVYLNPRFGSAVPGDVLISAALAGVPIGFDLSPEFSGSSSLGNLEK